MFTRDNRNQFIKDNFAQIQGMCKHWAKVIHRKYPMAPCSDLVGYAFEGVLEALDRVDFSQESWIGYVSKYGYHYALNGAKQMLGIQRIRKKGQASKMRNTLVYLSPEDMTMFIESQQFDNFCHGENEFLYENYYFEFRNEVFWLLKHLKFSIERIVLCGLIAELTPHEIAYRYKIDIRKVKKTIEKLSTIYQMVHKGLPIDHVLTHPNGLVGYRFYFKSSKEMLKTLFSKQPNDIISLFYIRPHKYKKRKR